MTLELWNTFATFGTFIVIAATAIAALIQLRHARSSNQFAAFAALRAESETPQYLAAAHAIRVELDDRLNDPEFRYQACHRPARTSDNRAFIQNASIISNFYETVGLLVKIGMLDSELALDQWAGEILSDWKRFWPLTAIVRREQGDLVLENFEYLSVLAEDWFAAHPTSYPSGVRRFGGKDEWLEADRQYAASRAPA